MATVKGGRVAIAPLAEGIHIVTPPTKDDDGTRQWKSGFWRSSFPILYMQVSAWPKSGDIGFSLWWRHANPAGGASTSLFWSEDGHPWNPRW